MIPVPLIPQLPRAIKSAGNNRDKRTYPLLPTLQSSQAWPDSTALPTGSPEIGSPPVTSSTLPRQAAQPPLAVPRGARTSIVLVGLFALVHGGSGLTPAGAGEAHYAIAMHGEPALAEGFKAARYVNTDAPKGGRLVEGVLGSFDSLNPFIVKGLVAQGIRSPFVSSSNVISGYVVESLMARGYDEPFTLYGLGARPVETDDARSYVPFTLDPADAFSDGQPVTPQDVLFSS